MGREKINLRECIILLASSNCSNDSPLSSLRIILHVSVCKDVTCLVYNRLQGRRTLPGRLAQVCKIPHVKVLVLNNCKCLRTVESTRRQHFLCEKVLML